jgi:hypothetical protein
MENLNWIGNYTNRRSKNLTKKIKSYKKPCLHPSHKPPMFRVYEPGEYEHICPGCGEVTNFTVPLITC